jgi:tryptophan synthase alpha subunit
MPTTPTDRMKEIAQASQEFLYIVSIEKINSILGLSHGFLLEHL